MEHRKLCFLAGRRRLRLENGMHLRLLTALEILQARREAEGLAAGPQEQALCANACILSRALSRWGRRRFPRGQDVLRALTAEEIAALAHTWADFSRRENPSAEDGEERCDALKKAWSTCPMSALSGVCSTALARCRQRRGRRK